MRRAACADFYNALMPANPSAPAPSVHSLRQSPFNACTDIQSVEHCAGLWYALLLGFRKGLEATAADDTGRPDPPSHSVPPDRPGSVMHEGSDVSHCDGQGSPAQLALVLTNSAAWLALDSQRLL